MLCTYMYNILNYCFPRTCPINYFSFLPFPPFTTYSAYWMAHHTYVHTNLHIIEEKTLLDYKKETYEALHI